VATLALGEEQPPLPDPDVGEAKAEDLAASQPAQDYRQHHGPVAVGPQSPEQPIDLAESEDLWKRG
jgi:hypothetical protein